MLKMIHNQPTDRLLAGGLPGDGPASNQLRDEVSKDLSNGARADAVTPANAELDSTDARPSIDAIVESSAVESSAVESSRVESAEPASDAAPNQDGRVYPLDTTAHETDSESGIATADRLREIRDWHRSKAQMSWSLETQQRHEDFATWLDEALAHKA